MPRFAKRRLCCLLVLGLVGAPSRARATTPEDAALAEELFRDAKRLVSEGSYAEACPKLAESNRLDPAGGTLLSLGLCHEAEGKTASAWSDFTEAERVAKQDRRADREQIAREHADALARRLSRLRIRVGRVTAETSGLEIRRDDVVLGRPAWDVPAPIDPGEHVVEALVAGERRYRQAVIVTGEGASFDVTIPEPLPGSGSRALDRSATEPVRETKRGRSSAVFWTTAAAGAVGVVALGASAFFFFDAKRLQSDADARCPDVRCGDPGAVRASHDAGVRADLATGTFLVGAVALGAATALLLLAHPLRFDSF